jgi:hypothetical protein
VAEIPISGQPVERVDKVDDHRLSLDGSIFNVTLKPAIQRSRSVDTVLVPKTPPWYKALHKEVTQRSETPRSPRSCDNKSSSIQRSDINVVPVTNGQLDDGAESTDESRNSVDMDSNIVSKMRRLYESGYSGRNVTNAENVQSKHSTDGDDDICNDGSKSDRKDTMNKDIHCHIKTVIYENVVYDSKIFTPNTTKLVKKDSHKNDNHVNNDEVTVAKLTRVGNNVKYTNKTSAINKTVKCNEDENEVGKPVVQKSCLKTQKKRPVHSVHFVAGGRAILPYILACRPVRL